MATEAIPGIAPTAAAMIGAKNGKKPPLNLLHFIARLPPIRWRRRLVFLVATGILTR